ncbi:MAG TPA: M23 family metallopeptidase [Methylovirgula sp.]
MSSGPVASYTAPAYQNQRIASSGSYANAGHHPRGGVAGWTAEGGMPVVVAHGESAGLVARRYSIPEDALLRTNGFTSSAQVRPGTRLVIPIYNASLAESSGVHVSAHRQVAERGPAHHDHLKFVKGPDSAAIRAKHHEEKIARIESEKKADAKEKRHVEKIAKAEHTQAFKPEAKMHGARIEKVALTETGSSSQQKKTAIDPMPTATARVETGKSAVESAIPEFRWPARGRVIEGFKIGANDGINIALPEGTSVKAADAGVVAYAGNGLKGYGNLILLRHSNGFVTAYANNGEINVKRGETVKRGQVIAKSGQSGNVSTPQLHFEVRKGAKPVNPIQYLAGL